MIIMFTIDFYLKNMKNIFLILKKFTKFKEDLINNLDKNIHN